MQEIERELTHQNPADFNGSKKRFGTIDSSIEIQRNWQDPHFILLTLENLGTNDPRLRKSFEEDIKRHLPKKTDITLESLGIYLTNEAFSNIEGWESTIPKEHELYKYRSPDAIEPESNLSLIFAEIDLEDFPKQPTVEEFSGVAAEEKAKQKMSEAKKRHWQNSEYRARMIESRKRKLEVRKDTHTTVSDLDDFPTQPTAEEFASVGQDKTVSKIVKPQSNILTQSEIEERAKVKKRNYDINSEDIDLWVYAAVNDLEDLIIKSGLITKEEWTILTGYFGGLGKKSGINKLLDKFSIAVARIA